MSSSVNVSRQCHSATSVRIVRDRRCGWARSPKLVVSACIPPACFPAQLSKMARSKLLIFSSSLALSAVIVGAFVHHPGGDANMARRRAQPQQRHRATPLRLTVVPTMSAAAEAESTDAVPDSASARMRGRSVGQSVVRSFGRGWSVRSDWWVRTGSQRDDRTTISLAPPPPPSPPPLPPLPSPPSRVRDDRHRPERRDLRGGAWHTHPEGSQHGIGIGR